MELLSLSGCGPVQVAELCQQLIARASDALSNKPSTASAPNEATAASTADLLFLQSEARRRLVASLAAARAAPQLQAQAAAALALLRDHPSDYHVVASAADALEVAKGFGLQLGVDQLQVRLAASSGLWHLHPPSSCPHDRVRSMQGH